MRNNHLESSTDIKKIHTIGEEIDYSPKRYTLRDQIMIGLKVAAIFAIVFLLLWLCDVKSM